MVVWLVFMSFVRKYTVWEKKMSAAFKKFPKVDHNAGNGNDGN